MYVIKYYWLFVTGPSQPKLAYKAHSAHFLFTVKGAVNVSGLGSKKLVSIIRQNWLLVTGLSSKKNHHTKPRLLTSYNYSDRCSLPMVHMVNICF